MYSHAAIMKRFLVAGLACARCPALMDVPQNLHVARSQGTGTPDLDKPRERGPPHPSSCEQWDFWRTGQAVLGEWAAVAAAFRAFPWLGRAGMWKTWSPRRAIPAGRAQHPSLRAPSLPCHPLTAEPRSDAANPEIPSPTFFLLLFFSVFQNFSCSLRERPQHRYVLSSHV